MKKQIPNFEEKSSSSLFKALSLVKNGALISVSLIIGSIIYFNFNESINKSFEARPEPIAGSYSNSGSSADLDPNRVVNGIHVETGMVYDENFNTVRRSCTSCHSSKLVIQNRATRDGWKQMIVWMQATQGLQDLGKSEVKILDYLEKNYSPMDVGRRRNLDVEDGDWYTLNLD